MFDCATERIRYFSIVDRMNLLFMYPSRFLCAFQVIRSELVFCLVLLCTLSVILGSVTTILSTGELQRARLSHFPFSCSQFLTNLILSVKTAHLHCKKSRVKRQQLKSSLSSCFSVTFALLDFPEPFLFTFHLDLYVLIRLMPDCLAECFRFDAYMVAKMMAKDLVSFVMQRWSFCNKAVLTL